VSQMMSFSNGEPAIDKSLFHNFRQRLLGFFGDFVGLQVMWLLEGGLWAIECNQTTQISLVVTMSCKDRHINQ